MFRKGIAAVGCMAVMAAGWSYAGTTWQLQTKLATAGGQIQVRDKALQTKAGSIVYSNFTTSALIPVTVTPVTGYKIVSVKKGTVAQTVSNDQLFTINMDKTGGSPQSLIASFAADKLVVTGAVTGAGSITPASATVAYNGTVVFSSNPSSGSSILTSVTGGTVKDLYGNAVTLPYAGPVKITAANVTAAKTVTANYATVSVSAGSDKVAATDTRVTLRGSVSGGGTIAWSFVSGPVEDVVLTDGTTTQPNFTPTVAGTYLFQARESLRGNTDTVEVVVTADVVDYMKNACDGCHNQANGVDPSAAFGNWTSSAHKVAGITCVSCHTDGAMPTPVNSIAVNPTNYQVLNASAGTVGSNYCSKCHGYIEIAEHGATAKNDCSVCHNFNTHSLARTPVADSVADSHIGGTFGVKAQYVAQSLTCANCHTNVSSAIYTEWAESKHGDVTAAPWITSSSHDWPVYSGGSCKRCHTGIGFVDSVKGTSTTQASGQPGQVLACTTCHSDVATGAIHAEAGDYTLPYQIQGTDAADDVISVPGASKICLPCHSGRGGGVGITASTAAAFNGRFPSHYMTAGATLFSATGYHFAGQTYTTGIHKTIGGEGPCVTCHMNSAAAGKGHTFEAVTKTDSVITAINNATACASCHADMTPAKLEADKASFVAAMDVLKAALETKGAFYSVASGKFYTAADLVTVKAVWASADELGAAYNYWLFEHSEPAAYVHNRGYALKLINDSIEFLNTDAVTGTYSVSAVSAATTGFGHATTIAEPDCASCHGATTPVAASSVACVSCHTSATPSIVAKVQESKHHAGVLTGHSSTSCQRCHSTEGYLAFAASGNEFGASSNGTYAGIPDKDANGNIILNNVSCSACHDSHNGLLRETAGWDPKYDVDGAAASNQFKLCTSCHGLVGENGVPIASGLEVSGTVTTAMQKHSGDWYRNIASSHYDLPTTGLVLSGAADVQVGDSTKIEGYNVRFNKESACTDCHGHELNTNSGKALEEVDAAKGAEFGATTIHTDWAQSAHAGALLTVKFQTYTTQNPLALGAYGWTRTNGTAKNAAVMAAGVTAETGVAWEHYNWDRSGRSACQKCHTATGVSNYLDAVAAKNAGTTTTVDYVAANNNFDHLKGWTSDNVTGSAQNEVLYCWGCHKSVETGELRVTGNMTLDYKANAADTANAVITAPGAGQSAVCISCHAGRGNAASLFSTSTIDPTATLDGTTTPKNSASATATHYLNAAATIFKNETKIGYEFPGLNYANPSYYKHNTIGCNDCHMPSKSHKFAVVGKDADGVITSLKGTNCVTCHTGANGTALIAGDAAAAAFIEEEAEGYKQAMAAFNDALVAQGYTWVSSYPYFTFTHADAPTAALKWRKQGDLGAGHNYNYLAHEPGAYAHNRKYAKRLIYDSIDWLDNNAMDGSVVINAVTYPHAATWLGATRP